MADDILTEVAKSKGDIAEDVLLAIEQAKEIYPDVFASEIAKKSLARKIDKISQNQSVEEFKEIIGNTFQNLNGVLNDNLGQRLKNSLKNLSGSIINNFEQNFEAIALIPNVRNRIAASLDGINTTSGIITTLNRTAREINETVNDNLFMLLKQQLGKSTALAEQNNFINEYPDIALDKSKRQVLFNQLFETDNTNHHNTISNFRDLVRKMLATEDKTVLKEDKLHQYLQPILGLHSTIETIKRLEELNPDLKGNEELQEKFINVIDSVPEKDKVYMVAGALKISVIKNTLAKEGDDFEFAGAYQNFENITTRLLKNFYDMGKYAENMLYDTSLSEDEVVAAFDGPIASAKSIILSDTIEKTSSIEEAKKEIARTEGSAAGGMRDFKTIVEYIAQKSEQAAKIMFNTDDYRHFTEWHKQRTIQKAQQQALTGKQETTDLITITKTGRTQNG